MPLIILFLVNNKEIFSFPSRTPHLDVRKIYCKSNSYNNFQNCFISAYLLLVIYIIYSAQYTTIHVNVGRSDAYAAANEW